MGGVLQSWLQCCHERGTSPISAVAETSRRSLDRPVLWAAVQLCCARPHRSVCDAGPRRASRGQGTAARLGWLARISLGSPEGCSLWEGQHAGLLESLRPQEISTRQGQKRDGCVHLFGLSGATLQRGSRLLKICVARFTTGLSSAALSLLPQGPSRRPPVCDVPTGRAALHDLPLCSLGRNPQVACLSPASPASRPLFVSPPQLPLSDTIPTVTPWFKGASGSPLPSGRRSTVGHSDLPACPAHSRWPTGESSVFRVPDGASFRRPRSSPRICVRTRQTACASRTLRRLQTVAWALP